MLRRSRGFIEHGTVGRAPAIPGLYRARYHRARSDDPGGLSSTVPSGAPTGGLSPLPRGDPPSYTRAPTAFPAVLRDDPRSPSPAVLRDNPPGRSGRRLPRLTGRSLTASRATPGATPPSYDPRLTTPVDTLPHRLTRRPPGRLPRLTVPDRPPPSPSSPASALRATPSPSYEAIPRPPRRLTTPVLRPSPAIPAVETPPS